MSEPLRLLSIGAGAIGTYIGGSLALGGHQVVFVERPDVAERLRARGLRLDLRGTVKLPAGPASRRVDRGGPGQSGLRRRPVRAQVLRHSHVPGIPERAQGELAAISVPFERRGKRACDRRGPGPGTRSSPVRSRAPSAGATSARSCWRNCAASAWHCPSVAATRRGGSAANDWSRHGNAVGLNARLFANAADMKWSKMLTNLIANATSAILDMTPGEIFAHPGLYRLEIGQLREALRVMAAQGIKVVDLPGTPVRLLVFAVKYLPLTGVPTVAGQGRWRRARRQDALVPHRPARRARQDRRSSISTGRWCARVGTPTSRPRSTDC